MRRIGGDPELELGGMLKQAIQGIQHLILGGAGRARRGQDP